MMNIFFYFNLQFLGVFFMDPDFPDQDPDFLFFADPDSYSGKKMPIRIRFRTKGP